MSITLGRPRLDVLIENQERRQHILNFLHANGAAHSSEIAPGINEPLERVKAALLQMRLREEVSKEGSHRTARYIALVETTISAQELDAMIRMRTIDGKARARANPKPAPPPETPAAGTQSVSAGGIHHPGDHPIKNQGGQGSLRRTVHVNCYQHY